MTDETEAGIRARGIRKSYGGVVALDGVDFDVRPGTVHALLGENGAGKSTLIKVLTGLVAPDSGTVEMNGEGVTFDNALDAARHGVAVVSQELNLFPDLDLLGNLFMGRAIRRFGVFDRKAMDALARPVLDELGLQMPTDTKLGDLSLAEQQLVEIARALLAEPRVLILDEPTSALDEQVSARLLHVISVLRDRKVGVVFVSHILEEVMTLSDVVTVLRDGRAVVRNRPKPEMTIETIVEAMVGGQGTVQVDRMVAPAADRPHSTGPPLQLTVDGLEVPERVHGVSLVAEQGEIVGLAGVVGAGHRAVLEVVGGVRKAKSGSIRLPRTEMTRAPKSRLDAVRRGVAIVSGDRKHGLLFEQPIWYNIAQVKSVALARDGVFLRRPLMKERARARIRDLNIKASSEDQMVAGLSGGNQQKVVMAKWIEASPAVMLLDDPTRGVAVGSKADIHRLVRQASVDSVVMLVSTDVEELVSLCDRVLVFRRGRIAAELTSDRLNRQRLLTEMNADADAADDVVAADAPEGTGDHRQNGGLS